MGILDYSVGKIKDKIDEACEKGHISNSERLLSVVAGGFILGFSAKRLIKNPLSALSGLALGGALLARGVTGKCALKGALENEKEEKVTVIERRYVVE